MSKYNNMKSIPVDSISEEELAQAIKEWAEGDDSMERLLWACYNNGIKTSGCHAGSRPYLELEYQENLEKIIPLIEVTQEEEDSQILICPDGGNPFSGPNWYLPNIGIGIFTDSKSVADAYFDRLTYSLQNEISSKDHYIIKLIEFFKDKESSLDFRLKHKEDKYQFIIEALHISFDKEFYYDELFTNAGLTKAKKIENQPDDIHNWVIESDSLDDMITKLNSITDYIISNCSLELPDNEDELESLIALAHYKKRTLSEDEFNNWLEEEREKDIPSPRELKRIDRRRKRKEIINFLKGL